LLLLEILLSGKMDTHAGNPLRLRSGNALSPKMGCGHMKTIQGQASEKETAVTGKPSRDRPPKKGLCDLEKRQVDGHECPPGVPQ